MEKLKNFRILVLVSITILCLANTTYAGVVGGPHLWLSTDPAQFDQGGTGYVFSSSDPWIVESYVPDSMPFKMYLYDALSNGKPDALNIGLMIAVHNGETGSISIKDEFGVTSLMSVFNQTDISPYYGGGNHGVYAPSDGIFAIYRPSLVINLSSSSTGKKYTWFEIEGSNLSEVHFDAFSDNGYYNPASHDVTDRTTAPEPLSISLFGLGLFGIVGGKFRRK